MNAKSVKDALHPLPEEDPGRSKSGPGVLRLRRRRWPIVLAVIAGAVTLAACAAFETVDYYWQGAAGQWDLISRSQPIPDVIGKSDAALAERLQRIREIRAFASHQLGLPDNGSYTRYTDLGRPFVTWNVFATPELSMTPRQWCFPIAGCVNYRGYFHETEAHGEQQRLKAAGDDVYVGGVPAYSTLGWFDDPVLSSFVRWPETEVARLIFHELAHQLLYVKGDSVFNESFATAVEEAGLARWLARAQGSATRAAGGAHRPAPRQIPRSRPHDAGEALRDLRQHGVGRRQAARQGGGVRGNEGGVRQREGRRTGPRRLRSLVRPGRTTQPWRQLASTPIACLRFASCCTRRTTTCRASTSASGRFPCCPSRLAMPSSTRCPRARQRLPCRRGTGDPPQPIDPQRILLL